LPQQLRAEEWPPVAPEDLAMKSNPKEPGAHAMILYREVEQNDLRTHVREYVRIKIFDEAGRRFSDVETLPYESGFSSVTEVKGRTIHPDGSVTPFEGKVFEKAWTKSRLENLTVSVFTLPDITPGSIVEYKYTIAWDSNTWIIGFSSRWIVSRELFQRKARFSFAPGAAWDADSAGDMLNNYYQPFLLPAGVKPVEEMAGGVAAKGRSQRKITLEVEDLPGVEDEEFSPPFLETRARVQFYYHLGALPPADEFWQDTAKEMTHDVESFMDRKGAMDAKLNSIAPGARNRDDKLQKAYDYVLSLRNLNYEPKLNPKEIEKLSRVTNVDDVVKHGYGTHNQLNELFVALARAAGFEANIVAVVGRDEAVFHKNILSQWQLGAYITAIRNNGKDTYFDPGTPLCPFGTLPWEYTAITGLRLDKKGSAFLTTPTPDPASAVISRKAALKLRDDGTLEGTVEVKFTGQEALNVRVAARKQDDAGRAKQMEDMASKWILVRGEIKLDSVNDWTSSTLPLIAKYTILIPHYAAEGSSMYVAPMVFGGAYRNPFVHENRTSPIYFHYPHLYSDDVDIALPAGYQVSAVPAPKDYNNAMANYSTKCTKDNGVLHMSRTFRLNGVFVDNKYYSSVRSYFGRIQDSDDEQAMLAKK
jgi:hypothetical protein